MDISLGEALRQLRRQKNITQSELGGEEYSKSYVSGVERGNILPSLEALHLFARRLGLRVETFDALLQRARAEAEQLPSLMTAPLPLRPLIGEGSMDMSTLLKLVLAGKNPYMLSFARIFAALFNEFLEEEPQAQDALYASLQGLQAEEQGDFVRALTYLEYALVVAPTSYLPAILGALGTNYFLDGQYHMALSYHLRARRLVDVKATSEAASRLLLTIELRIGDDYRALARHRDACDHYHAAREHLRATHDMQIAAQLYLGLGYCTYAVLYQDDSLFGDERASSDAHEWEKPFQRALSFLLQSRTLYQVSQDVPGEADARLLQVIVLLDLCFWRLDRFHKHLGGTGTLLPFDTASLLDNAEEQCRYVLKLTLQLPPTEEPSARRSETPASSLPYQTYSFLAYAYLVHVYSQRAAFARVEDAVETAHQARVVAASLCQRVLAASAERGSLAELLDEEVPFSAEPAAFDPSALPCSPPVSPAENETALHDSLALSEIYFAVAEVAEEFGRSAETSDQALHCYSSADQYFQAAAKIARRLVPSAQLLHNTSILIIHYCRYIQTLKARMTLSPKMGNVVLPLLFSLLSDALTLFHTSSNRWSMPPREDEVS